VCLLRGTDRVYIISVKFCFQMVNISMSDILEYSVTGLRFEPEPSEYKES
jgi:hypothetical protein